MAKSKQKVRRLTLPPGTALSYSMALKGQGYHTSGGVISSINDQSGNGCDLSSLEQGGALPLLIPVSQGGFPAIGFNGLNYIWTPDATNFFSLASSEATMLMVARGRCEIYAQNLDGEKPGLFLRSGSGAKFEVFSGYNEAGGNYSGLISDSVAAVITARVRFGKNSFRINGAEAPPNNIYDSQGQPTGLIGISRIGVGALMPGSELQEILVVDGFKSDSEIATIEEEAASLYGIALA